MTSTFLVTLEIESPDVIPDTAIDLEDDLLAAGHDVITVKPWARPTLGMATPAPLPPSGGMVAPPSESPPSLF